jgi:hypothetical protein
VNPRIGDTVHYVLTGPNNPCCAALVCDIINGGQSLNLRVNEPNASVSFGVHAITYDPNTTNLLQVYGADGTLVIEETNFTPGTWHPTH